MRRWQISKAIGKYGLDILWWFLLVGVVGFIFWRNYVPGTWLLGWDSVASEFNLKLALERSVGGGWQEFQGLGMIGGHGYMADLVHVVALRLVSLVVSVEQARYGLTFLLWLLGGLGAYVLVRKAMSFEKREWVRSMLSLVGALVYLLHLITAQTFFVPHDAFVWFYGWLPWSLVALFGVLDRFNKKRLLGWFLVQLGLSFAGFIPPLMVVYGISIGIALVVYGFQHFSFKNWGKVILVGGVFLVVQAYWLLPVGYFVLNKSDVYLSSKLNNLTTAENNLKSEYYGDLESVALGKSFYFDSLDFFDEEHFAEPILKSWLGWLEKPWIKEGMWGLFGLAILGVIVGLWQWRRRIELSWVAIGAVAFSGLAIKVWPFFWVFERLRDLPLVNQVFRLGFTKFSTIYILVFSVMVAMGLYGLYWVLRLVWRRLSSVLLVAMCVLVVGGIVYLSWPVFEGKLVYDRMRVEIPDEYLSLMRFWDRSEKGRIAVLPAPNILGWDITRWGYTGSGFLFYGVRQPMLHSAFNVWSGENETFYQELAYAVYGKDEKLLEQVLTKYQVRWLLLDESIFVPGGWEGGEYVPQIKSMLDDLGLKIVWQSNFLSVYDLWQIQNLKLKTQNYTWVPESYSYVEGEIAYSRVDPMYASESAYVEIRSPRQRSGRQESGVRSQEQREIWLFSDLGREKLGGVKYEAKEMVISRLVPDIQRRYVISLPLMASEGARAWFDGETDEVKVAVANQAEIKLEGEDLDTGRDAKNCDLFKRGEVEKILPVQGLTLDGVTYKAWDRGASCDFFNFSNLDYGTAYVMRIVGENVSGRSLKFYLNNNASKHNDLEVLLDEGKFDQSFVILTQPEYIESKRQGYTLNLETRSFGREIAEDRIERIEFYPIPFKWMSQIKLVPFDSAQGEPMEGQNKDLNLKATNPVEIIGVEKWGTSHYRVAIGVRSPRQRSGKQESGVRKQDGLVALGQGYDEGWKAYAFQRSDKFMPNLIADKLGLVFPWWLGTKLEQVKVNGWSNGWLIPDLEKEQGVVIIYWPQYLEWLGLGLLVLMGGGFVVMGKRGQLG